MTIIGTALCDAYIQTAGATLSGVNITHAIHKRNRWALSLIGFLVVNELKALISA